MCGIAGFVLRGDDENRVSTALASRLERRGPDGRFFRAVGSFGLVQTRLAVVDLSDRVEYPMPNETNRLWLLFNGEIYNHPLLRRELEGLGHSFATSCDAEVVIHGFEEWGSGVFPRLDGMFALAIIDRSSSDVILARDAAGIKPLVRTTGDRFAFSSDVLSLVDAGLSQGEPDRWALGRFLSLGYVPPPHTGLSDVEQIPPGTALVRRSDGSEILERWSEPFPSTDEAISEVSLGELERVFTDAVHHQLEADVEVGILLSGGLDSSLIAATARDLGAQPQAFTIGFSGHGDYDETAAARRTAEALGLDHHVETLSLSFRDAIDLVGFAFDQPFADSSAIPMLEVSRLARRHVTVVLSGTGGDDLFAGYYRYRAHLLRPLVGLLPTRIRYLLSAWRAKSGSERGSSARLFWSYLARLLEAMGDDDFAQYFQLIGNRTDQVALDCVKDSELLSSAGARVEQLLPALSREADSTLRALQGIEFQSYLPGDLLTKEDRASMAFGLEARVPMLDKGVVGLASRMPDHQKISLLQGKRALNRLFDRGFPDLTRSRQKRGFAVPLGDLFSGPWQEEAADWFGGTTSELVDGQAVISNMRSESIDGVSAWTLAALMAWEKELRLSRKRGQSEIQFPPA